jgi:hypothetical protein
VKCFPARETRESRRANDGAGPCFLVISYPEPGAAAEEAEASAPLSGAADTPARKLAQRRSRFAGARHRLRLKPRRLVRLGLTLRRNPRKVHPVSGNCKGSSRHARTRSSRRCTEARSCPRPWCFSTVSIKSVAVVTIPITLRHPALIAHDGTNRTPTRNRTAVHFAAGGSPSGFRSEPTKRLARKTAPTANAKAAHWTATMINASSQCIE